jgi:hypothetical protein
MKYPTQKTGLDQGGPPEIKALFDAVVNPE